MPYLAGLPCRFLCVCNIILHIRGGYRLWHVLRLHKNIEVRSLPSVLFTEPGFLFDETGVHQFMQGAFHRRNRNVELLRHGWNGRETGQVLIGTVNQVNQDRERTAL